MTHNFYFVTIIFRQNLAKILKQKIYFSTTNYFFSNLLEAIVLPGKIPATCAEHADRGAVESGLYEIKPSVDVDAFFVTCDFRNCCRKNSKNFKQKKYFRQR